MRALSLTAPRTVSVTHVDEPEPGPGEVLIGVTACGVCGSDLNAWRGVTGIAYPLPTGAPGHEVTGTIKKLGADVTVFAPGDRVTGLAWNGFAESVTARAADLVRLPPTHAPATHGPAPESPARQRPTADGPATERPAAHVLRADVLGEPLACAMNVVRRALLAQTQAERVAVVGFGYLAALTVQLFPPSLREWIAISRRHDSRALAERLGAAASYDFDTVPSAAWETFDLVIETAGAQRALDYATWLTSFGGRLVIAGYHADGPRTVNMQTWNWKGIDVINAHERRREVLVDALQEGLRLATERHVRFDALHTHQVSLSDAGTAFRLADERPSGFIKAVVCP
ncbi:MAG: zinc-binding dehydrogenase [Chloroflexota bacterium]